MEGKLRPREGRVIRARKVELGLESRFLRSEFNAIFLAPGGRGTREEKGKGSAATWAKPPSSSAPTSNPRPPGVILPFFFFFLQYRKLSPEKRHVYSKPQSGAGIHTPALCSDR